MMRLINTEQKSELVSCLVNITMENKNTIK
jgi:hypothetical protein